MDFQGEHRSNETHPSTTDSEARLLHKGREREARLAFQGYTLMENRQRPADGLHGQPSTSTAERDAVPELLDGLRERGYRLQQVTPHATQKKHSAIDQSTDAPCRPSGEPERVEEVFGWMLDGYLVAMAHNLVRMANLLSEPEATAGPSLASARPQGIPRGPQSPCRGFQDPRTASTSIPRTLGYRWYPKPIPQKPAKR